MGSPGQSQPNQEQEKRPNIFARFDRHMQGRTMAGLLNLLPLLATIVVILFFVGHADNLIRPLPFVAGQPWDFTGIGIIVLFFLFYFVGLMVIIPPGRRLMDALNFVLARTPIIKTIFGVTKQATTAMTSQYNFSRVVFLEWPREGMVAMGFVTGRIHSRESNHSMVVVYIPTVPNPTSGNMAFVLEDDIIETDLSVEAAMKLVFSGGIVLPEAITLARVPRDPDEELHSLTGQFRAEL